MPRERIVKNRLSDAELARLDQLAATWGIATRAGLLRALLRGAGPPDQPPVPGDSLDMVLSEIAEIPELDRTEIDEIGRALNLKGSGPSSLSRPPAAVPGPHLS